MNPPDFDALVARFGRSDDRAIVLMGSFARGDAGPYSDIDLVRFVDEEEAGESTSHLVDARLVVVSAVTPAQVESWFCQPEEAVRNVAGLRTARPLWDPEDYFRHLQKRARDFVWDQEMQRKAGAFVSREMVGWIEEVHKGLQGLRTTDVGRLLNARFGLSWGLIRLLCVARGVLLEGDNSFFQQALEAVGDGSRWARLCRRAFGIETQTGELFPLSDQVRAGLALYALTAEMLIDMLQPGERELVLETARLIQKGL